MSVLESFTLPSQPSSGTVTYTPLGGDGFHAPFAAYVINSAAVTGDATGGNARVACKMDDRYCSMIGYLVGSIAQSTPADALYRFTIAASGAVPGVPTAVASGTATHTGSTISSTSIDVTWVPPAAILPGGPSLPQVIVAFANADADVFRLSMLVYLFDIRVRELTPMGPLLFARGAGSDVL